MLATHYGEGPLAIAKVCDARQLGKEYLTKIFASLSRAGLITPVRGKGGGYMLARDPREVSLLEVIEAVEGPIALNLCQAQPPRCDQDDCTIRPVWAELQAVVTEKLSSVSLKDCIRNGSPTSL